jgi:predicted enzyme related to lactoylglutathione lyase
MHFYTELLGAEIEVAKASDVEYPMLKKDGRSHAGFFKKDHDDVPSHWYPYIEVGDVDATVEQAKSRLGRLPRAHLDGGHPLRSSRRSAARDLRSAELAERRSDRPVRLGRAARRRRRGSEELLPRALRLDGVVVHGGLRRLQRRRDDSAA